MKNNDFGSLNLDKITKLFLKNVEQKLPKPIYEMSFNEARVFLNSLQRETHREIEVSVEDKTIYTQAQGSIDLRIIRPKDIEEEIPAIVYVHGGGWVLGNKDTHDMFIKRLSVCAGVSIIFVEYTPSPEAKFPSAQNQVFEVLKYLQNHSYEFNINKDKIILAGDSAGANIAVSVAMKAKYCDDVKILMQLLIYPVADSGMDTKSYEKFQNGPWLTKKAMKWFWEAYLPEKGVEDNIYASILKATPNDLEGLPPTFLLTAENDVLRDEGELFAKKLQNAGVEVFCVRINGAIHDFLMLNALRDTIPAKGAFNLLCTVIKEALQR